MEEINEFLKLDFELGKGVHITVKQILLVITVLVIATFVLRLIKKIQRLTYFLICLLILKEKQKRVLFYINQV